MIVVLCSAKKGVSISSILLGAIGVVELKQPVDIKTIQPAFVEQGVWVRAFDELIYLMLPYIISDKALNALTSAIFNVISLLDE